MIYRFIYIYICIYVCRYNIQIHQHFSLQRCSTLFSAARPVLAATLRYDINHNTTSDMPCNWKNQCIRKMAASQSRTVHSKTHRVCPINKRNVGPIGPISSTIPSSWIQPLPKGRADMPWMIQWATVPGKCLRRNHVRYIPRPTGSVLSKQKILDPSVQYPVLNHHLESSPYPKAGLICHYYWKRYCTWKIAAFQSSTVHSKTHSVCPIHTKNGGYICKTS